MLFLFEIQKILKHHFQNQFSSKNTLQIGSKNGCTVIKTGGIAWGYMREGNL